MKRPLATPRRDQPPFVLAPPDDSPSAAPPSAPTAPARDEGAEAWLRHRPLPAAYAAAVNAFLGPVDLALHPEVANSAVAPSLRSEWSRATAAFLAGSRQDAAPAPPSPLRFVADATLRAGHFRLFASLDGLRIHCSDTAGALHGLFRLIDRLQARTPLASLDHADGPRLPLRLLNHWDNVHPSVDIERGYGGESLWRWPELPGPLNPRYADYARLLASVGINGLVLNNVNASQHGYKLVTDSWIPKVAALAGAFRAWGVRVGLSVAYDAPVLCGDLATADPREPAVQAWWRERADALYAAIPDFLGYLVKADSEGQAGPATYGLDHAEGSRLLADSLAPHGGRLFWRAFVYDDAKGAGDLMAQPYRQFRPLDGRFAANLSLQVKNGPRDFQVREPLHPLIGTLPATPVALELQITQEYLGHDVHAVFLPSMWEETLRTPAHLAPSAADALVRSDAGALVGVSNVNDSPCWTGHLLAQANLYGFARLAWDPHTPASVIAHDWAARTFDHRPEIVATVVRLLLASYRTFEGYTAPFCLGQLYNYGTTTWDAGHYDPGPWCNNGKDWFHADAHTVGIDRSPSSGRGFIEQYPPVLRARWGDPATCPSDYLLWFHRLPWEHRMPDGRTLIQALYDRYHDSAAQVDVFIADWLSLADDIEPARFEPVLEKLRAQRRHARLWARYLTSYLFSLCRIADSSGRTH